MNKKWNKSITLSIVVLFFGVSILPIVVSETKTINYIIKEKNRDYNNDVDYLEYFNDYSFFDILIALLMRVGHFPSLSVCIVLDNEVVWSRGYGVYDINNMKPATEYTTYMTCSISKTITGAALMHLYDQGLFNLDDDVDDYLPFSLRNPNFPDYPITFRMLLSHSSSLNNDPESFYWFNYSVDPPVIGYPYPWLEEYVLPEGKYYVPEIWNEKNPPGETAKYANVNFVICAFLVEILSGESFIDYCDEHLFDPLDMEATSFNLSECDINNVAIPYHFLNGRYVTIDQIDWLGATDKYYRMLHYPVGGLYTSVLDLSHFLIMHMNGGMYNNTRILEKDTLDEMHKIQPPGVRFGLAWYYTGSLFGKTFSGHEGDVPGYHNSMLLQHPENNIGVIFFVNGDRYTRLGVYMAVIIGYLFFLKAASLKNSNNIYENLEYDSSNVESFPLKQAYVTNDLITLAMPQKYILT